MKLTEELTKDLYSTIKEKDMINRKNLKKKYLIKNKSKSINRKTTNKF